MKSIITSREYKVMLRHDWFAGSETALLARCKEFWLDFQELTKDLNLKCRGEFDEVKVNRQITFLDTKEHFLNKNSYVFRERVDLDKNEKEITLKFRHRDRFISQERDMATSLVTGKKAKIKFEEDLKLPFDSLYSFSTTKEIDDDQSFDTMKKLDSAFPGLEDGIDTNELRRKKLKL